MWYFIETDNGLVLDYSKKADSCIVLASKHGGDSQLWKLDSDGILHNKTGCVADIPGSSQTKGTKVIGYSHQHNGPNQKFAKEGCNIKSQMHGLFFDGGQLVVGSNIVMQPKQRFSVSVSVFGFSHNLSTSHEIGKSQQFYFKVTMSMDNFNKEVKSGLQFLEQAVKILASQTDGSFKAAEKTACQMLPVVNKMREKFKIAEKISDEHMHDVQGETEQLIQDIGKMQRKMQQMDDEKKRLSVKMKGDQSNLNQQKQTLTQHQNRREELQRISREADEKAEAEAQHRRTVTGVGAGLMVIPIIGWIAGGTMIAVGETALADNAEAARVAARGANDQLDSMKRNVEAAQQSVERIQKQMKENENGLNTIGNEKKSVEGNLESTKSIQREVHDLREKLQSCMKTASSFFTSAKNTSTAVKHAVSLEQMVGTMGDLMLTVETGAASLPVSMQRQIGQAQLTWDRIKQHQPLALDDISEW